MEVSAQECKFHRVFVFCILMVRSLKCDEVTRVEIFAVSRLTLECPKKERSMKT